jgi:polar amino acid transport system substrate-binding protein
VLRNLLLCAALLVSSACNSSGDVSSRPSSTRSTANPPLLWGGDAEGGAPFVEADPSNPSIVKGFDVEIAGMIADGLHRSPQFVQVAWASIEASVERGDFAIGMSGVEDRPSLRAQHAVTIPYFQFREVLAVRPADTARFHDIADLRHHRVATLGGTGAYEILLADSKQNGVIPVSYDDDVHPYEDLVAGRVDAVLLDNIIAERSLRRSGGFIIQPHPVATGYYVGVLAARNSALRDSVNAIIRARMLDGSLERTFRKWNVWTDDEAAYFMTVAAATSTIANTATRSATPNARGFTAARVYLPALARAAVITIVLSVLSMALAVSAGILIAAGRVYGNSLTRALLTFYVEVVRGTPVLLQLFVIYYGLSGFIRLPAFAAAILGLGLNYAAYESEIYRAALESISKTQLEAASTLGFSELQTLKLVRGPQALRLALAPMTNDFVSLLKDTSLVSVITVVELTKQTAIYAANIGSWVVPGIVCAVIYLLFSLPLSHYARRLERRWNLA